MDEKVGMKVLKNGVLSKKFGLKLEKIKRRLQEILYVTVLRPSPLPNITGVFKSTRRRGGVAQCGTGEIHIRIWGATGPR